MPKPAQQISKESITLIINKIEDTIENGISIRNALADYSNSEAYDISWEVQAAVEALQVFGSRWTIEILSSLYIAGPRRFNEMKTCLKGYRHAHFLTNLPCSLKKDSSLELSTRALRCV